MRIRSIHTASRFDRSISKLPKDIQIKVSERVAIFKNDPFTKVLDTHKLKGKLSGLWSFSITRSYRILFDFQSDSNAIFYDVGDHRIYQ